MGRVRGTSLTSNSRCGGTHDRPFTHQRAPRSNGSNPAADVPTEICPARFRAPDARSGSGSRASSLSCSLDVGGHVVRVVLWHQPVEPVLEVAAR